MAKPSIVRVLEHYGFEGLHEEGSWHAVRCEFHGDRHASASYNPDENVFVCHACDIKGDAYSVVMRHEGISFAEAKSRIQELTGSDDGQLPERTAGGRSRLPLWAREKLLAQQGNRPGGNGRLSAGAGRRLAR